MNVVVAECNDSHLNDMRVLHVRPQHAIRALFGWKGGIGTASRRLPGTPHAIGVLVLGNFGSPEDLTVLGVPVGRTRQPPKEPRPEDGSVIAVVATDIPWDALLLGRLARRVPFGIARTGSIAAHGSGDIAIAFSTEPASSACGGDPPPEMVTLAVRAVVEATEEAVLNALAGAETTVGRRGRVVPALPMEDVRVLLRAAGR